uniref:TSNAX-DISC1 readthrough (NMD candidate) n=1 Tax=Oryzias sinensis TaxID=183150 RepID=A0A8C8A0K8_9TELE
MRLGSRTREAAPHRSLLLSKVPATSSFFCIRVAALSKITHFCAVVFQQELDTKHDKYERLVKISRDITIESKRTIFLLHRVTNVPNTEEVLKEAELKLEGVRQKIGQVAEELRGEDIHQFHRAFTPGEFVIHLHRKRKLLRNLN